MKTKMNSVVSKVSTDLFFIQMKWSLWYILITFVVFVLLYQFVPDIQEEGWNVMAGMFQASRVYMLVIGIMTVLAFFSYYVKNGITRKDYFSGSAIAAVGVAFSIMIVFALLTGVLELIGLFTAYTPGSSHVEFLNTTSVWIVPILVYSLIILCYYVAGWMVVAGYLRFGGWGCLGFVGIALLFLMFTDLLWEGNLSHPLVSSLNIPFPELSISVSYVCTLLLIAAGLWVIYLLSKRAPIKPE